MALLPLERVRDGLFASPSIFPQNLDWSREAILFLALNEPTFRAASFLDDRILTAQSEGRWVKFDEAAPWFAAAPEPQRSLHFIFHAGHVGSTLVSRLLDQADGVLGLREPLPLRVLAEADDPGAPVAAAQRAAVLDWMTTLWARGYDDTRAVVLKATSSAARLAPKLMAAAPASQALYLNLAAEPYLATLLAGENSPLDLRGHGAERHRRFARLTGAAIAALDALSLGELAALTWAVETLTQRAIAAQVGARLLSIDFDDVLREPGPALRSICAHFGLTAPEAFFEGAASNPVLTRYSKAPEHQYSPALRQRILAQSRGMNGAEIRKGLAWLEAAARQAPALADALSV